VPTGEGWLYLATILDLFNREVVGYSMSSRNDQLLTAGALRIGLAPVSWTHPTRPASGGTSHAEVRTRSVGARCPS